MSRSFLAFTRHIRDERFSFFLPLTVRRNGRVKLNWKKNDRIRSPPSTTTKTTTTAGINPFSRLCRVYRQRALIVRRITDHSITEASIRVTYTRRFHIVVYVRDRSIAIDSFVVYVACHRTRSAAPLLYRFPVDQRSACYGVRIPAIKTPRWVCFSADGITTSPLLFVVARRRDTLKPDR